MCYGARISDKNLAQSTLNDAMCANDCVSHEMEQRATSIKSILLNRPDVKRCMTLF